MDTLQPLSLADYTNGLRHSLDEKLFFLDRLPDDVSVFAEFGCADGSLLREVVKRRGAADTIALGYDHDPEMIALADHRDTWEWADWTSSFNVLATQLATLHAHGRKSVLILSSVVHEVMSQNTQSFYEFWLKVRALGCNYIAVRDMAIESKTVRTQVSKEDTLPLYYHPKLAKVVSKQCLLPGMFRNRAELLQCLLKYRFTENLEKECQENYFPLTVEQWLNWTTIGAGHKLRFFDHRALPFLVKTWQEELGVSIKDPTHIYLLLQRTS